MQIYLCACIEWLGAAQLDLLTCCHVQACTLGGTPSTGAAAHNNSGYRRTSQSLISGLLAFKHSLACFQVS